MPPQPLEKSDVQDEAGRLGRAPPTIALLGLDPPTMAPPGTTTPYRSANTPRQPTMDFLIEDAIEYIPTMGEGRHGLGLVFIGVFPDLRRTRFRWEVLIPVRL